MPCVYNYALNCRTFKSYLGVGNPGYHGELCTGCHWWTDMPADLAFKARDQARKQRGEIINGRQKSEMLALRRGSNGAI